VAQGGATSRRAPPSCSPTTWPASRALPHESLSERELQVFLRLAKGESVSGIADTLKLSVKTVSTYRSRLLEKLEVASNAELAAYALRHGLMVG
jgi:DNA-binding NarL/FixJ family response regulator